MSQEPVVRKLKNRRRHKRRGNTIRVSESLYAALNRVRHGRSWDCFLRRAFGLVDRFGNEQPLIEGMLETMTGKFILRTAEPWDKLEEIAYEIAILTAAKQGAKRVSKPLRMRELP